MTCEVKMILASRPAVGWAGPPIYTLQLRYWRAIHAEFMTHRDFSRNASSSRAIPVKKMLTQVWNDPAGPIHWGANQAGMQARAQLVGWRRALAGGLWRLAGKVMCGFAWGMMQLGLHKQVANRLLEPWQYINVVVTSTKWENFFALRCHPDAQPEFRELAERIREVIGQWTGYEQRLQPGEWHLPWASDTFDYQRPIDERLRLSGARCAAVSYMTVDGAPMTAEKAEEVFKKLMGGSPFHASPFEHQAMFKGVQGPASRNFDNCWWQYRALIELAQ
jgi:hypothetical protein